MSGSNQEQKLHLCQGCRDHFYNTRGDGQRCWLLENAKVVTRYKLGWWTQPTAPGAYTKVKTLHCWHSPGQFAMHEKLPDCVTSEERKRVEGKE